MRQLWLNLIKGTLVTVVAVALFLGGALMSSARAAGDSASSSAPHTQALVDQYLAILNTGMSTSQCDFSKMSTIYAANARLTASGGPFAPGGPFGSGNEFGVQEFDGIQAITGFYTKLCHILYTGGAVSPGWTQDAGFLLAPNVLNSFEHLHIGGHVAGRCMHVFTVHGDRISSLDWSVYQ